MDEKRCDKMRKQIKRATQSNISNAVFFKEIRELILSARRAVVRNVDTIQVVTNFEVGRRIVEQEQKGNRRAEYGDAVLVELSRRLTVEFGRGFSRSNLEYMRKFYLLYQDRIALIRQTASAKSDGLRNIEISQMPSGKLRKSEFSLSWSQYVFLVSIKDAEARSFYEIEAAQNGWSLFGLPSEGRLWLYENAQNLLLLP